jgi:hypothetical protein
VSWGFCDEQSHYTCSRVIAVYRYYIHIHTTPPKGWQRHLIYSSEMSSFYHNYLAMKNTAEVTSGMPIAVWSQSISDVSAINPLIAFYDIHGRKREVLFFYFAPDTTRVYYYQYNLYMHDLCLFIRHLVPIHNTSC